MAAPGTTPGHCSSATTREPRSPTPRGAACVDQALFPTVGSANPVLTGLCLTRKAAETIVTRHISAPAQDDGEIATEKAEGFVFLLEAAESGKWMPNDAGLTASRPALIEGGTIIEVHGNAGLGVLFYDEPTLFQDFELRLQWKAFHRAENPDEVANSGIFLRAPGPGLELDDASFYGQAIEIQIDDTGYDPGVGRFRSPLHRTGAVYGIAGGGGRAGKDASTEGTPGNRNDCRVLATGSRISVSLNDRIVSEGVLPPHLVLPGMLALQYHSGKVQFRAIRIRRL